MEPISTTLIAKPLVDKLITNLVIPKIEKFSKYVTQKYQLNLVPKGQIFSHYIERTYNRFSIVNTLARSNNQMLLKNIYLPLTLTIEKNNKKESTLLIGYPKPMISKYQYLLIEDSAGMGKSTISKRMYLDIIDNGYGIPIFIELRRLNSQYSIIDEICSQLNSLSEVFDKKLALEFIQTGGFIFFLDGYDEISLNERENVTDEIQDFITKANNNIFIMTSRPESALTSFGYFQKSSLNPLKKEEAYELLRKYDDYGDVSTALIEKLKSEDLKMIDDFLKNPLLVSLLFVAFDYKQTIPLKKHIFYRQVFDAHFESHDISKGGGFVHEKKSGLDIDDFDRILRYIGLKSFHIQKIEFSKDELLKIIGEARQFCVGLSFKDSDFMEDLLTTVPLFHQDGTFYKWAHKSLQEYFAAEFIYKDAKGTQDSILNSIYTSNNLENYYNLLDLYYDIDIQGFRKNILLPFLKEYQTVYNEEDIEENIEIQKALLFMREGYLIISKKALEFEEAVNLIKEIYPYLIPSRALGNENNKVGTTFFYIENYVIHHTKRSILVLLSKKQAKFISYYKAQTSHLIEKLDKLELLTPYAVIPSPNSILNKMKLTDEINYLLAMDHLLGENVYISRNNCIQEIKKIEDEITFQNQSFNLWNFK